ncbi:MAG: hypothetical protein ACOYEH_06065 [Caldicoprobacterales bacterium]|nr:hypothetical protein [Clostridiales bacterium]
MKACRLKRAGWVEDEGNPSSNGLLFCDIIGMVNLMENSFCESSVESVKEEPPKAAGRVFPLQKAWWNCREAILI